MKNLDKILLLLWFAAITPLLCLLINWLGADRSFLVFILISGCVATILSGFLIIYDIKK